MPPGASVWVVVGFYVFATVVVLFGVWVWFGPLILNLLEALFPWPIKYPMVSADDIGKEEGLQ